MYSNGENQWIKQTTYGVNYSYDGDGERVEASGGSSGTRIYWYDESGNVLSESDQNGATKSNYIYLNGQRIAQIDVTHGATNYYLVDHLGTTRKIINQAGTLCYDADFFPWGNEQHVYVNNCSQDYKFTGKEQDPDMGIIYFGARFYQDPIARFYTPDWSSSPEPVPYSKLDHPQSLNLYTYAENNPASDRDPDGHDPGAPEVGSQDAHNPALTPTPPPAEAGSAAVASPTVAPAAPSYGDMVTGFLEGIGISSTGLTGAIVVWYLLDPGDTANNDTLQRSGPKAADAPGVTAGGQATDKYGNKLGPSGEAQVDKTKSTTREGARNKALGQGSGAVEHKRDQRMGPHFHPSDANGEKKPSSAHHEYPE